MKPQVSFLDFAFVLIALAFVPAGLTAAIPDSCELPADLKVTIEKSYPNRKIVSLMDLSKDNLELYEKDHGRRCPGLVEVDFYGDGRPTLAMVLFGPDSKSVNGIQAVLVLAHKANANWEVKTVETTNGIPVVWKQKPGKYTGVYGDKTIQAQHPVIVFCGYNSWAVLYAWTGTRVSKIWLSD
jgi:hypothetical protein